ncbi:MAG: hypothetical protein DMF62_12875 [Acidobacteria bacterium]|nr:MAG: hypothetical protein DMF62_12875 [Acidobacteriota bacterium]
MSSRSYDWAIATTGFSSVTIQAILFENLVFRNGKIRLFLEFRRLSVDRNEVLLRSDKFEVLFS